MKFKKEQQVKICVGNDSGGVPCSINGKIGIIKEVKNSFYNVLVDTPSSNGGSIKLLWCCRDDQLLPISTVGQQLLLWDDVYETH